MMRWHVLKSVTRTVLLEHVRTPEAVFWAYGFPLVMALVLGFAFSEGRVEPARIAVVEDAAIAAILESHAGERLLVERMPAELAHRGLTLGSVDLVVAGDAAQPTFELDPRRPGSELARLLVERAMRDAQSAAPAPVATIREVDEPGDRYIDFLIAGLIGMNLFGGGMYGIGYNLVLMRSNKLLRRLSVTPMSRSEFLTAFMASRTVLALPAPALILAFGMLVFGVPVRGSWLALIGLVLLGAVTFAGLGLLVASRTRTTESVSGLINVVTLPMWLLGGIFFSNERFPAVLQPVIHGLPMTQFTDAMRGVMLGSFDPTRILVSTLALGSIGLVTFVLAVRLFRWS